ncbi:MAG: hypothetical protein E4H13_01050 [Calditrichales bacterium]|nr:MAG: hypothetical protein E4H13_01050 [Calditrichales bacterium]
MIFKDKSWHIFKVLAKKKIKYPDLGHLNLSESDLFNLDLGKRGGDFFLGYFSPEGLKIALEKYGLFAEFRNHGFKDTICRIDTSDSFKHKICFYTESESPDNILVELVLRKSFFKLNMPFESRHNGKCFRCLTIDWMAMQNPRGEFSPRRPRLPGQKYPGLGLSAVAVELLMITCWRLGLGGLVNFPGHYHNAFLYSKIFYYLDPVAQAKFIALKETFKEIPLDKLSWGIDWGCVTDLENGLPFSWMVGEQLVPLEDSLKDIFRGRKYNNFVENKKSESKFEFNEDKYQEIKKKTTIKSMEKII